jgi:hypothetical protein
MIIEKDNMDILGIRKILIYRHSDAMGFGFTPLWQLPENRITKLGVKVDVQLPAVNPDYKAVTPPGFRNTAHRPGGIHPKTVTLFSGSCL